MCCGFSSRCIRFEEGENVELADLGTPAFDLTHQIVGLKALILVDAVAAVTTMPGHDSRSTEKKISCAKRRNSDWIHIRPRCRSA
jgi:Ni,Fe-hydrogenase maturation factor